MDPDRARFLRQHRERRLDLALDGQHQVGKLVNDEHDIGQNAVRVRGVERQLLLYARLRRQRFARSLQRHLGFDLLVEIRDIARVIRVQQPVASLHFPHGPLQDVRGLVMTRDDRQPEMWQGAVHRQLHHLRIDHEQLQLVRAVRIDETRDDGVDADRFSGAGCPGDEEVRHFREIVHDLVALEVAAQDHRQHARRAPEFGAVDQIAHVHEPRRGIGHLDADRRFARNRRHDAQGLRPHGERQIVGQRRHPAHFHAAPRLELEPRDDRANGLVDDLRADAECLERRDQPPAHVFDLRGIGVLDGTRTFGEQLDGRDEGAWWRRWCRSWRRCGLPNLGSGERGAGSGSREDGL